MTYRLIIFLHRKPGTTHAEFRDHYEYVHIPLTRELTGSLFPTLHARRYIDQGAALMGGGDDKKEGETEADAVVEVAFRDEQAAQAFFAATNAGEAAERLRKDNEQFLDWQRVKVLKVSEAFETRGDA
ncbi:hypothetical protein CMUS01_06831 [Colletotrichum musicola]|uniref:EthD domain-containing protein n=1 Tax=Colletotrichum musicola TaxID=2175873 RepID=A0A8H6NHI2_9PEZI|nr:hypothetical protein CMUS01_06831 [Colletotrichum musicola]